jgi:clan AA aspartic protease (TIGR02281 family)
LREDQSAWVHSYSASCGASASQPVPVPVPASMVECFRRAGEARLAYLRSYGTTPAAEAQPTLSPRGPVPSSAVILMQSDGGTYIVPVRINDQITLRFVVDSGASDVSLPADVALTLIRTGTIEKGDYIGDQSYTLGDGSTIKSAQFVLHELRVGDQVVRNVKASIGDPRGVPLLGQSFLTRFASWTLDNDRHALVLGPQRDNPLAWGASVCASI